MIPMFDVVCRATGERVVRGVDRATAESERRRLNTETVRSQIVDGWAVNFPGDEYGSNRHVVVDTAGGE
jgi:hypothetical protein